MARVKPEHSLGAQEDRLLAVLNAAPEGLQDVLLRQQMGGLTPEQLALLCNRLLNAGRLQLLRDANGKLIYKAVVKDARTRGLSAEELLVYQGIKAAGNTGVWTRDLKISTNLAQPQVTKVLKALEGRALIKTVKSVAHPGRKLYMCAEMEPSREVTGGAWYTQNVFDAEFIGVLREACARYVAAQGGASLANVAGFVEAKGFSKVKLAEEDVRCILDTLVYDGRVELVEGPGGGPDRYRPVVLPIPESTPLTEIPCGVCPVFSQCKEGAPVSPLTCVYYTRWLEAQF